MVKETYKKAMQLNNDIWLINYHLRKAKEDKTWITISTPLRKDEVLSSRFQRELIEWLEKKSIRKNLMSYKKGNNKMNFIEKYNCILCKYNKLN